MQPRDVFGSAYFALQRMRGGVTKEFIRQASSVLASGWESVQSHVFARLTVVHGEEADKDWLASRPLTDRPHIHREFDRLSQRPPPWVEKRKTSGSTGTPAVFYKDREMTAWMDATMWAAYEWHDVRPGDRHARFWGMPRAWSDRLIRRGIDRVLHRRRFDAFHLSAKRVGEFFNSLKRFRPTFVYGYPTLIRAFAELCIQQGLNGRDLHVNVLISTGELLPPDTRKVIGEFFDCRVVNEYGCTESGILSMECEFGTPHVVPVAAFPEVVDADGHPKDMGEMGEVVVTDLYGEVMPLLRYRLHDAGSLTASHCPCGRDLPRLEPSSGRIDSFIQTPRRGPVYDAILAYSIPPGVQRFRAFQVAVDHLTVQVVPGVGFQDETAALCRERLERALGPDLTVSVQVVHDIPTEASGKLRYFVPLSE